MARARRPRRRGTRLDARAARGFLAFGVVTVLLTAYLAVRIVGADVGAGLRLRATFDDVSGLREGDIVKVAGTPVGRVTSVKVVDGRAAVAMKVRPGLRIPDDSAAAIRWRDLIGRREVYLETGTSRTALRSGGVLTRTRSAADLGALINDLGPLVGGVDPNEINKILQSFATALDGNRDRIDQITGNLAALLRLLGTRTGTVRQMISDYRTVTGALAARDRQIAQTITSLTDLTQAFAQDRAALGTATAHLGDVAANLDAVLGTAGPRLGRMIDGTRDLMEIAHRRMGDIDKMIKSLPSALQALLTLMDGGKFLRGNALCMNIVYSDTCPFPENLPPPPAVGSTGASPAVSAEAARLTPQQQQVFKAMVQMAFLGGQNGAAR
ncbi:MCE family protein [Actinomadura parmotrematis]|uniref:MCE family protein n=1 Tax=Actinomadura parmotrematis TaxID=2864039 RepID=A0ABS7G1V0_9ACTN|nr:MCE family protein [Actinomadura parmotrematis]MBW8486355.1 MCE family protein [Actinomadura parmotrematis]